MIGKGIINGFPFDECTAFIFFCTKYNKTLHGIWLTPIAIAKYPEAADGKLAGRHVYVFQFDKPCLNWLA